MSSYGRRKIRQKRQSSRTIFCAQGISLAHEFAQKSSPFCKRANLSQEVSCCKNANSCKSILSSTEMDKENVPPPAQDSEASLEALLEEVARMETVNVKTREDAMVADGGEPPRKCRVRLCCRERAFYLSIERGKGNRMLDP